MRSLARSMPVSLAELLDEPFKNLLVEIVAAQVGVAVGGLNLEHAFAHLQDGNVKGSAAQVKHGNGGVLVGLVQAVGQGGGGGFVDDAQDVQAGNGAGVLGCLALGVVESKRGR